jgi:chemotaxis protein methyltransferase CheR
MSLAEAFRTEMPGISPGIYNPRDFAAIAALIKQEAGIMLPEGKAMLVYSRLAPLVRDCGAGSFANFIALVASDQALKARMIAALTTNHTFFYREAHHFEHFASEVRAGLIARLHGGNAVRMWSAGCSSGEETWSLVMTLLGADQREGERLASRDLRVLASDLAPHAVEAARRAVYGASDLKPVPEPLRRAWTRPCAEKVKIADTAAAVVRFRQLNLLAAWPFRGQFDIIFCRNVMIYFDNPTKQRLVSRFAEVLAPGGYLYIGHSERVSGPAEQELELIGPTIYRKVG